MTMRLKRLTTILSAIALTALTPAAIANTTELEEVAEFHDSRAAGVTVSPDGRLFVSMHPLDNPEFKVLELMANGEKRPFPTIDWADGPLTGKVGLASVLGIHSDSQGIIWMLDMGSETSPTQLIGWNSAKNKLEAVIKISKSSLVENSFAQDFAIDEKRGKVYIADMSFGNFAGEIRPAIIVLDLATGKSRRVMQGIEPFVATDRDIVIEGGLLASVDAKGNTNRLRFGLNPIAIDENFEWVYFATMNGEVIHRIPADSLANSQLSDGAMQAKVEIFGPKKPSDGMLYVPGKGIAITDLENNAVGLTTRGGYQVLVKDDQLSWPDSMAWSNGYIYVTADQLHQHPAFSQGKGASRKPYQLLRFKLN